MNRIDRLYAVMEELRAVSPRPLSAARLARRFEVSTRTIERDLLALQESGVPIYAETGRTGGYVLDKRHSLPPLNFTATEAAAIAVALAADPQTPFAAATRSALHKVLAAMPDAAARQVHDVVDRVRMLEPSPAKPDVPQAIQNAISAAHALRLHYVDKHDRMSERTVEPSSFVHGSRGWYLVAWCRLREQARVFRLDRIVEVADTGEAVPHRSFDDLIDKIPEFRRPSLQTPT